MADIFQLHRSLSETHGLPLQLVHQEQGFVLTLRKIDLEEAGMTELPTAKAFLTQPTYTKFWQDMAVERRLTKVEVPTLEVEKVREPQQ